MRLDKYLANIELLSRKESRRYIRRGGFYLNGEEVFDASTEVSEGDILEFGETTHTIRWNITMRLWKPSGYVSSDRAEGSYPSYKDLLEDCLYAPLVHIAGRLDVDTEGLLVLTSDGSLNHQIISPKRKQDKEYIVTTQRPVSAADIQQLEAGVTLDDGYVTLPARCTMIDQNTLQLIITEGKFHQVKRMLEAVGNTVTHLKRVRIGDRTLDGLTEGAWDIVE